MRLSRSHPLPAQHVPAIERDQHAPALEVGAITHHHVQDLTGSGRLRHLSVPAPPGCRSKPPRAGRPIGRLPRRFQQPGKEPGCALRVIGTHVCIGWGVVRRLARGDAVLNVLREHVRCRLRGIIRVVVYVARSW